MFLAISLSNLLFPELFSPTNIFILDKLVIAFTILLFSVTYCSITLLVQNKVPIKDIQIWLGHSNIQTTMIYTHMDETNKEVSAQVLVAKFQYILTNYNENEIYEMKNQTLNNLYEDMESLNQIKNVVATVQV